MTSNARAIAGCTRATRAKAPTITFSNTVIELKLRTT